MKVVARRRRFSDEPFGSTVERLMVESRATYRETAAGSGSRPGNLNHIVHGNRPVPSDERIEAIARAFGVEPEYFLNYRLRRVARRLETTPTLMDSLYRRLSETGSWR
jgi:transcriptional regulator with XRE-family HTH domain